MKHAISALLALVGLLARSARAESEYDVKAAFLFKFTKSVDWPDAACAGPDSPFVIGIVGHDPFEGGLDRLIEGNTTGNRRLEVRHINASDSVALRGCQMIFVSASEQRRLLSILSAVQGRPALVGGDSGGVCSAA